MIIFNRLCGYNSVAPAARERDLEANRERTPCSKERFFKLFTASAYGVGGVIAFAGCGYAYLEGYHIVGPILAITGTLNISSAAEVIVCLPIAAFESSVNHFTQDVDQASIVEHRLDQQTTRLDDQRKKLEEDLAAEKQKNIELTAQLTQIRLEREQTEALLKDLKKTNQELDAKIKPLKACSEALVATLQGMDKDNDALKELVSNFKTQLATLSKTSSEISQDAATTTSDVNRLDQENVELKEQTEKLSSLVASIIQSSQQRQKELAELETKIGKLKRIDDSLAAHAQQLTNARQELKQIKDQIVEQAKVLAVLNQQAEEILKKKSSLLVETK